MRVHGMLVMVIGGVLAGDAGAHAQVAGVPADSLLRCADRLVTEAGFRAVSTKADRVAWMRQRDAETVDAMRAVRVEADAKQPARLAVDAKTLLLNAKTGLGAGERAAPQEVVALADSVLKRCFTRGQRDTVRVFRPWPTMR
jgi:hypothetical protein